MSNSTRMAGLARRSPRGVPRADANGEGAGSRDSSYLRGHRAFHYIGNYVDVAVRRLRVRTLDVRRLGQLAGRRPVDSRQAHVQAGLDEVAAVGRAEIHFGIDGGVVREPDPPLE